MTTPQSWAGRRSLGRKTLPSRKAQEQSRPDPKVP